MKAIQRICETKRNGKYEVVHVDTDPLCVYEWVTQALVAKKLHKCTYIRSIRDKNNCDGTRDVTIYYTTNLRVTCTIKEC